MVSMKKISIITVCYNSDDTIKDTLKAIESQDYHNIEYIIVDGGSTDNTIELIKNSPAVTQYISEPDQGIYDAMNKGINMATGDIIGTLNADDFYFNQHVLSKVAASFQDETVDAIYGDLVYVNRVKTDEIVRLWKAKPFVSGLFKKGWVPPHPTFFARKEVYDNFGSFNLKYKLAADFELLFRMIEVNQIKVHYLPEVLVKMRLGGATNKNISNIIKQNKEIISVLKEYYPQLSTCKWLMYKINDRLKQFIRNKQL